MINIINYIKKLVDEKDSASSKIAMGLMFAFFTILLIIAKIVIVSISMDVLYFTGGMVLSLFGLNSIDKFRKNSNDSSVVNTETHVEINKNSKEEQIN
jgi:small neutral amino acid transporter SnatA (MarC family)